MGPTWVLSAPGWPHVGPTKLAIREVTLMGIGENRAISNYIWLDVLYVQRMLKLLNPCLRQTKNLLFYLVTGHKVNHLNEIHNLNYQKQTFLSIKSEADRCQAMAQTSDNECRGNILSTRAIYEQTHDGVIKWKHFPRDWPFVRGIHRSPVNSPHKGQWRGRWGLHCNMKLNNIWTIYLNILNTPYLIY